MGILLSSSWFLLDICPPSSPWISALLRFCFHLIPQVWSLVTKESSSGWSCAVLHGLSLRWKPVRWSNWSPRLWERWNNNCMTVLVTGSTFPVAPQCWQSWCHKNHCHQFMIHDWISFLQRHEFVVLSDVLEVCSEDLKMSALPADHRKYFGEMMEEVPNTYSSCQLWDFFFKIPPFVVGHLAGAWGHPAGPRFSLLEKKSVENIPWHPWGEDDCDDMMQHIPDGGVLCLVSLLQKNALWHFFQPVMCLRLKTHHPWALLCLVLMLWYYVMLAPMQIYFQSWVEAAKPLRTVEIPKLQSSYYVEALSQGRFASARLTLSC